MRRISRQSRRIFARLCPVSACVLMNTIGQVKTRFQVNCETDACQSMSESDFFPFGALFLHSSLSRETRAQSTDAPVATIHVLLQLICSRAGEIPIIWQPTRCDRYGALDRQTGRAISRTWPRLLAPNPMSSCLC